MGRARRRALVHGRRAAARQAGRYVDWPLPDGRGYCRRRGRCLFACPRDRWSWSSWSFCVLR